MTMDIGFGEGAAKALRLACMERGVSVRGLGKALFEAGEVRVRKVGRPSLEEKAAGGGGEGLAWARERAKLMLGEV